MKTFLESTKFINKNTSASKNFFHFRAIENISCNSFKNDNSLKVKTFFFRGIHTFVNSLKQNLFLG